MPYNFVADSIHTKKLCSALSSIEVQLILRGKQPYCVFEAPKAGLGATYDVHIKLTGKCVVNFLVNELFRYKRISKIGVFAPTGSV